MERLTQRGFNYDHNFVASHLQSWPIAHALKKLQQIEDAMEDQEHGKTHFDQPAIAPPPNAPLTLGQLREMDGEPVYVKAIISLDEEWCIVMTWELPESVEVQGVTYPIITDYRCILEILTDLSDPETDGRGRALAVLIGLYPYFDGMPPEHYEDAVNEGLRFINCGSEDAPHKAPRLMDWEQDYGLIIAPVNRVIGGEVRAVEHIYAENDIINTSDRNKKKNIQYGLDRYSALFDRLRPVSYQLTEGRSGRTHLGLIAQDVEDALAELGISTKEFAGFVKSPRADGGYDYALRYGELIALLIREVRELKRRVAQ